MEQQVIDHINDATLRVRARLERSNDPGIPAAIGVVTDIGRAFLGEIPFDASLVNRALQLKQKYYVQWVLQDILSVSTATYPEAYPWTFDKPVIRSLVQHKYYNTSIPSDPILPAICLYIFQMLSVYDNLDTKAFISFLHEQGFTDEDIITICTQYNPFYQRTPAFTGTLEIPEESGLTAFSKYLIPLLTVDKLKALVDQVMFQRKDDYYIVASWLKIMLDHHPQGIDNYGDFLIYDYQNRLNINVPAIFLLIEKNAAGYESIIIQALETGYADAGPRYGIMLALNKQLNGKYRSAIEQTGEQNLYTFLKPNTYISIVYEPDVFGKPMSVAYFDYLFEENAQNAQTRLKTFYADAVFFNSKFFTYTQSRLGAEALPLLLEALKKDPGNVPKDDLNGHYYFVLFENLMKYDLAPYREILVDFAVRCTAKPVHELACRILSNDTNALADAQALLKGKTTHHRITATLILSQMGTPEAVALLNDAVEKESNDDIRDIMLETLQDKFKEPYTTEQLKAMIRHAASRKKLNKWNEKWIDETRLPGLFWRDSSDALDEESIRFLFYRMKRAKGLNSDIEARQLLNHIDRGRSQAFAKALLIAFQDSNADTKLKYYLTLAALLGDDDLMNNLNALFKKNIADKRMKMAESVVGALAMIGSDKALRIVEVIYRKFASKKPSVSQAAKAALDAAAQELGLTTDELADKIIPNFDFDGIYKTIMIDGDEYRAFISSDFKLSYFTEDNKIRKSLPSNASKELKAEFKDIEKEVNDVVKSQSGRLEKYMVEERRWPVEHWRTFFFNNPIMFVYALKLLWGVYDKDGKLVNAFYCSEDTSLYDVHDEEVDPEDEQYIGIIHPLHLSEEALSAWKDKLYTMSMVTIFPILERRVFAVDSRERELTFTKAFFDQNIPKGADFVNTFLVKRNWHKGSGDSGSSEFTKSFKDGLVRAYANIEGPSAWYQGGNAPAKMFEVSFLGKNWNEKVALKDVPPIFYSEVLTDIDLMINAN